MGKISSKVNAPNPKTGRVLYCATHGGKDEMVEFLLSHSANINICIIRNHVKVEFLLVL